MLDKILNKSQNDSLDISCNSFERNEIIVNNDKTDKLSIYPTIQKNTKNDNISNPYEQYNNKVAAGSKTYNL